MLHNKQGLTRIMERDGLDAVVASSPQNVLYTTDVYCDNQWVAYYNSQIYAIILKDEENSAIVSPKTPGLEKSWIKDLRFYGKPALGTFRRDKEPQIPFAGEKSESNVYQALVKVLTDKELQTKRVGFDQLNITLYDNLKSDLPKVSLVDASGLFNELRLVKTEEELTRLQKVAQATERAIEVGIDRTKPGVTDSEIHHIVDEALVEQDCSPLGETVATGGPMTSTQHTMKEGDALWFDIAAINYGYCSDMGRTIVLGEPSERFRQYYHATFLGQEEALKSIREGVKASAVFDIAAKTVRENGIPHYQRHACGHGIGLGFDLPEIGPDDETPLKEGMVLCIETPYREVGFGGMMLEDMIVVRKNGFEFLTRIDRNLRVL